MALRNDELTLFDRHTLASCGPMCGTSRGRCLVRRIDDRVMALALANEMRQYAFMPLSMRLPQVDDYWTVDWFARMVKPEENPDLRIGATTVRGTV